MQNLQDSQNNQGNEQIINSHIFQKKQQNQDYFNQNQEDFVTSYGENENSIVQSKDEQKILEAKLRKEIKKINISDEFLEQLLGKSYDDINKSKSLLKKLQNTSSSNENSHSEETSNSELESEEESDNDVLEVPDLIPRFKYTEKGRQGDQNFKKLQKQRTVTEHIINRKNAVSVNQMFKNKKRQNTQFVSPKEFNTLFNKEIDKQQLDIQQETEDQDDHEQSQDTDQAKEFIQKFNQNNNNQIIEEVLNDSRSTIQYDRSQRASSNFTLGANTKAQHILNNRQSYGQRKIKNSLVGQQTQFD
ncbi:hypothetical protein PPERSA_07397 [Pseudocohnilembus persalinus]|uniref:Uncharacterized protein n=1 Tax=Pseudocohnilembus persalinus TaxID=266149 RepID=A0A0V0QAD2_PSEPJ|nr:hypothetical protein PPERSA_07397 [Pseudocohnilembus persalinus]|eukprot:KRW99154.1 hypothetical protein PPERSA_07397 [Pseudocohnilembus persalinus]